MWPDACSLAELPFDLYKAVEHASAILTWQENLTREEMPPEWMWSVEHELTAWFQRIDEERNEKYGGGDSAPESTTPMMTNELADEMKKNRG